MEYTESGEAVERFLQVSPDGSELIWHFRGLLARKSCRSLADVVCLQFGFRVDVFSPSVLPTRLGKFNCRFHKQKAGSLFESAFQI